ncbi:MAG: oligosaccharide flippase family protein, partial [Crocinitomicaceae bacterium]|nr:oligosaccharide flippase family protein [Crocinitomicaceae bacterium]
FTISALSIVPRSLMIKEMRFRSFFTASMVSIIGGNLIVGLALAWLNWDIWAYVWALFAQNALMTLAYWWLQPVKIGRRWEWKYTRELIRYGSGSTLFNALNYAATKVDVTIVPLFTGSDLEKLRKAGIYERSSYVMSLPITIMAKLSDNVLFSGMAQMQDEAARLRKMIIIVTNLLSVLVIPATVLIIFFSPQIIRVYLGPNYYEAIPILQVLFCAVIFRTLSRLCDSLLRARDAVFRGSWVKGIYLVLMIIGVLIASPFGMVWVAASIVATTFIHYLMSLHLCRQLIHISWAEQLRALIPGIQLGILSAALAGGAGLVLSLIHLPALIFLMTGISAIGSIMLIAIYRFPQLLGKKEVNPLLFIPDRWKKLPFIRQMIQRL